RRHHDLAHASRPHPTTARANAHLAAAPNRSAARTLLHRFVAVACRGASRCARNNPIPHAPECGALPTVPLDHARTEVAPDTAATIPTAAPVQRLGSLDRPATRLCPPCVACRMTDRILAPCTRMRPRRRADTVHRRLAQSRARGCRNARTPRLRGGKSVARGDHRLPIALATLPIRSAPHGTGPFPQAFAAARSLCEHVPHRNWGPQSLAVAETERICMVTRPLWRRDRVKTYLPPGWVRGTGGALPTWYVAVTLRDARAALRRQCTRDDGYTDARAEGSAHSASRAQPHGHSRSQ
ncbi:MAG: hypothetical protein ACI9S9_001577, partial [Planctomycetota bacterium]